MISISKEQAKRFLVKYHHLSHDNRLTSDRDILSYINKVGCIQYDPINILSYNSHLVLQSRLDSYKASMLDRMLYDEFELIDGWDKNLSIYKATDHTQLRNQIDRSSHTYNRLHEEVRAVIPSLLDKISADGPLSSTDVKDSPQVDWWWAPTKAVRAGLDYLFGSGQIYVHHKVNTRKYYDLISNHPLLSNSNNSVDNDDEAYLKWHILRRIGGVGLLPALKNSYAFIAIRGIKAVKRREAVHSLVEEHLLTPIAITGLDDLHYIRSSDLPLLLMCIEEPLSEPLDKSLRASIIAPLDNLIWDRDMIKAIFDFDYIWEVYKPKHLREYGYYVLPILYGNNFVGRFEGKYNRQKDTLEIVNWFFETNVDPNDSSMMEAMSRMLHRFRVFLGARAIKIMPTCRNKKVVGQIKRAAK